jgi:tetratricopeptide (TPR) repeat protein
MNERTRVALLPAAATLVYGNSLLNSFTYDDFPYVLNNPAVTNPSIKGFFEATRGSNVFRPVTFASFALNWLLGNVHALGYHLFNLLLHAAVTVLLYFVLRALLENVPRAETIAFVAALLFAVHPIHTEAVASIAGRSELLAAAFLLAAWLFHLHDRVAPALVCFVLAMLSKESAVAFLPLALAGDYVRGKLKPLARYAWIAVVALLYMGVLWKGQGGRFGEISIHFVDNPLAKLPAMWRVLNALRIAWKYVGLQIYPAILCCDYSYDAIKTYISWRHTVPAAIATLVVVALWAWAMWTRRTGWALAGAIYLAGFSVTANILIPTGTVMGERLAYVPSAGFCLLVALVWIKLANHRPALAWAALGLLVAALGVRTVLRNGDWRTNFTLFLATARAAPESARAHSNLGAQYMDQGKLDIASTEFQTALRIFPDFPDALEFYGLAQSRQGHNEEARQLLERAFSLTQKGNLAYDYRAVNLAAHLIKIGEDKEGLTILDDAIREEPRNARAWSNRAVIHYRRGELALARTDAQTALRLDAMNLQARNVLGAMDAASEAPMLKSRDQ